VEQHFKRRSAAFRDTRNRRGLWRPYAMRNDRGGRSRCIRYREES
jgi:hypothetical protein